MERKGGGMIFAMFMVRNNSTKGYAMRNKILLCLSTSLAASFLFAQDAKSDGPSFAVSGSVEFEANTHYKQVDPRGEIDNNAEDDKWFHDYSSTFDLLFQVKFNDEWSAEAAISADDDNTAPGFAYDGAFIQYQLNDKIAIKAGDMTYSEGAFRYYDYDDPGDAAAGMMERSIRGIEVDAYGLVVGLGFGTDDDDCDASGAGCTTYDAHVAYELALGDHTIRPYVNYKSYQVENANSLRAGVTANLVFGTMANVQLVYGLYSDALSEDSPKMSHAFTVEPEVNLGKFSIKGTAYYALLDDDDPTLVDAPEYMFAYVEPLFAINDLLSVGVQGEYHTMTLDSDAELAQAFIGPKAYFSPVEKLSMDGYFRACIPLGDDYGDSDDVYFGAGASVSFEF